MPLLNAVWVGETYGKGCALNNVEQFNNCIKNVDTQS